MKFALVTLILVGAVTTSVLGVGEAQVPGQSQPKVFGAVLSPESGIRLVGRSDVVVTEPMIRLENIAQIESPRIKDDEAIMELRKLVIATSPKAGDKLTLEGAAILDRMRSQGVLLDTIRYTLPREVTVTRAFREVSLDELEKAVMSFLDKKDKQLEVRRLLIDKPVRIPADSTGVNVLDLRITHPGQIGVDFQAISQTDDARFQLRGIADQWRMLPVASKPLKRGEMVTAMDVEMQKVNGTAASRGVLENIGDIVGHNLTRDLGQGEMFRDNSLVVPPVVLNGSRVTLLFRESGLEATATGTALENGVEGQEIKIRNDTSKRIVTGKVVEPGLVNVGGR